MNENVAGRSPGRLRPMIEELFGIDARSLALYRVGFAMLILLDLGARARDLQAHYTDLGVLPREVVLRSGGWTRSLSLHLIGGSVAFEAMLFIVAGVAALFLLAGYRTRVAALATWVLLVSLQGRNNLVNHGGDVLLRCLGFWNLFLPLGAAWSVDRALDRSARVPVRVLSAGTAAALLQLVFMYWFGAMLKTGPMWRDGTALFYALHLDGFATPFGIYAREFPNLLQILTHATLQLEAFGPFLAFIPLGTGPVRCLVIGVFVLLHLGMGQMLFLGLFPAICMVAWVLFLPSWFWERLEAHGPWPRLKRTAKSMESVLQRVRSSRWLSQWLRERQLRVSLPAWKQALAGILLLSVYLWNVRTLDTTRFRFVVPDPAARAVEALRLDQNWEMFAPQPGVADGWNVVPGRLRDRSQVDLFRGGAALSWDKPPSVTALFRNVRWQKWMMNLWEPVNRHYCDSYAKSLCRSWNEAHSGTQELAEVDVLYVMELTRPDGHVEYPGKLRLCNATCGSENGGEGR